MKAAQIICLFLVLFAIVGCGDSSTGVHPGPMIGFNPDSAKLEESKQIQVLVELSNMKKFFAISFDLLFDKSIVSISDVDIAVDCILGQETALSFFNETENGISVGVGNLQTQENNEVSGDGSLVILTIKGKESGIADIRFENVILLNEEGNSCYPGKDIDKYSLILTVID